MAHERNDLYDSDRTMILRKLSPDEKQPVVDDDDDDNEIQTTEQIQRRMKAFALTKRMKRIEQSRNAIYGIMAIEKERENDKHFSLNQSSEIESDQK